MLSLVDFWCDVSNIYILYKRCYWLVIVILILNFTIFGGIGIMAPRPIRSVGCRSCMRWHTDVNRNIF